MTFNFEVCRIFKYYAEFYWLPVNKKGRSFNHVKTKK